MAFKVLWDEQETAILVDYFMQFKSGTVTRADAIKTASIELRKRAMKNGLNIEDTYRNENGITMQMIKIEDLFNGGKGRLSKAPKVFEDIVNLYIHDNKTFEKLLEETKVMSVQLKSEQTPDFYDWLTANKPSVNNKAVKTTLSTLSLLLLKMKSIPSSIVKIHDVEIIKDIINQLRQRKVSIHSKKQIAVSIDTLELYKEYLLYFRDIQPLEEKTEEKCRLSRIRVAASHESIAFYDWLLNVQNLADATARSYSSAINNCEQLANTEHIGTEKLYGVPFEEAQANINLLILNQSYVEANASQHNRLRSSLQKFLQYLSGGEAPMKINARAEKTAATKEELNSYETILVEYFPKGFRATSNLDIKKFIHYYNKVNGTDFDVSDEGLRSEIRNGIIRVGIRHEDYIFAVNCLLSTKAKERLLAYIEQCFATGKKALYYRAIFEKFNEDFLGQRIYDEDMLRTYLMYENPDKYYYERSYMTRERNIQVDPTEEIQSCLVTHASPMKLEDIYASLSHLPADRIDWAIHTNKEFVCNTWGEYFYISLIDFSDDELTDISQIIDETIEESHFIGGNELINSIRKKYPSMLDRFPQYSMIGIRDAIAYYLKDKYSFTGNIISSLDKQLSMGDVFAEFAKTHRSFTIDELNVLKNEMNSTIYFESIYENSLRISKKQFISKDEADFDVAKTDKAIGCFCTGDYISIRGIPSFGIFPYAGFPWNIYLLEHYVAAYSSEYKLLHVGFNADNCVGAIVKRKSHIDNFNDLITNVLAHSGIDLNKKDALQYLCDMGYLARRRFTNIDQILIKSRAQKG